MTREEARQVLEGNPYYHHLFDEFEGRFSCIYNVAGVKILLYNVGGHPEFWFAYPYAPNPNIEEAQSFVRLAYEIIRERHN